MKLISWNVNGLRACLNKGFMDFFSAADADIFCVQETKMQPDQAELTLNGYTQIWNSALKKGYSGTAVFTRPEPLRVCHGMGIAGHDGEGRLITVEYPDFFLVNVYTPNSQKDLARLDYRMQWEDDFRAYVLGLEQGKPVVICGDMNVAHREIDIKNPRSNGGNAGFTPQEREKISCLLDSGYIDTFRYFFPDQKDAYTWWSYMFNARANNVGWRIDYFLASQRLRDALQGSRIHDQVQGSDHCPVELTMVLPSLTMGDGCFIQS